MTVPPKLGCHLNAPITAFWATAGPAPYSRGNIWTRSVVHVGTSHPEKSECSVQIGFCSANGYSLYAYFDTGHYQSLRWLRSDVSAWSEGSFWPLAGL